MERVGVLKSGTENNDDAGSKLPIEMGRLVGDAQARLKQVAAETKNEKVKSNNPQERALEILEFASILVTNNPPVREFLEESKGATHFKDSSGSTYYPVSPYSGVILAQETRKIGSALTDPVDALFGSQSNVGVDRAMALSDGTVIYGAFGFDPKENPDRRLRFLQQDRSNGDNRAKLIDKLAKLSKGDVVKAFQKQIKV